MIRSAIEGTLSGGGEMGRRMRELDWSTTPLGPVEDWPQSLKTSVSTCLNSRFAILIWWGPQLVKIYNDSYRHILGRKHPAALGASGRDVWPEIWHIIGPMLEGVMERGEATWSDNLLLELERDGYPEECYFTFSYSPIRDETGGVGGIFTPVQETTRQVIGERRLHTLRDLAQAARASNAQTVGRVCKVAAEILAKNPWDIPFAAVYLLSEDGRHAFLYGSAGITSGAPLFPSVFPFDGPVWPFADAVRSDSLERVAIPAETKDIPCGAWPGPPGEAVVIPVGPAGQRSGFLILAVSPRKRLDEDYLSFFSLIAGHVSTAISEVRAYEDERKRAQSLAELDRAKTQFFSNVSHEFRTPLTLMLGPLEDLLAARSSLPSEAVETLSVVHRNGMRLLRLVNSLLDFSRIEAGRARAFYEPVNLPELTAELASGFRAATEHARLALNIDCSPLSRSVYVDRDMWEKIVLNLISNAFKFTFEGSITIRLREAADHVALSVSDTGVGIPENELPHVFERFHRVEGSRGRTYEGTGIGLALVQELVRLHGGAISLESTEGQGSTFTITIPFGKAHLPADQVADDQAGASRSRVSNAIRLETFSEEALYWLTQENAIETYSNSQQGKDSRLSRPERRERLLIADDNADMRGYLARLLSPFYDVNVTQNGEAALAAVRENRPDLVLSDVMMPVMDGFKLLRALRSDPATKTIPIVLLSARAGEEAHSEGLDAGADDYLVKPFSARELLARVGVHLRLARLRKQSEQQATSILESITDGFCVLDRDWNFVYFNNAAERIIGMSRDAVLGRNHWELFPGILGTQGEREYRCAVRDGVPVEFEQLLKPYDRWYSVRAYPTVEGGLSIYFRDITDQKQAAEALRSQEALRKAEAGKWRELFLRVPAAVAVFRGPQHVFEAVNDQFLKLVNRTSDQLLGKALHDALPELAAQGYTAIFDQVFRTGAPYTAPEAVAWFMRGDSTTEKVYMNFVCLPTGGTGAIDGTLVHAMDVTEIVEARKRVEESEQRFRQLADSMPQIVWVSRADGVVEYYNERWYQFTGLDRALPGDQSWEPLLHPDDLIRCRETWADCVHSGQQFESELRFWDYRNSKWRWFVCRSLPVRNAAGEIVRWYGTSTDIDQQKVAQEALLQTQKLESIGLLAGGIAHDFNNLLVGIMGGASYALDTISPSHPAYKLLQGAVEASERAAHLTRQMLAYAGKGSFLIEPVDLSELVTQTASLVSASIPKSVHVEYDLDRYLPTIHTDSGQMQQVAMNLIINAAEAIGEERIGSITIRTFFERIEAGSRRFDVSGNRVPEGEYAVLEVRDTGTGIDPANLAKIFDPFFTTKFTGRGLGLAAVQGIVRSHKGAIEVETKQDRGSTFRVLLPIRHGQEEADSPAETVKPKVKGHETILVIDDEPIVRRVAKTALEQAGYRALIASTGRQGLESIQQNENLSLVLLDMSMPEMSGREVLEVLSTLRPRLPVIVCSGYSDEEIYRQFTGLKMAGVLQKPFTVNRLFAKVRSILDEQN